MSIGKMITLLGVTLVVIGLVLTYAPWLVNWFGKLPGDIRIQNEKSFVFIPVVSMLIAPCVRIVVVSNF